LIGIRSDPVDYDQVPAGIGLLPSGLLALLVLVVLAILVIISVRRQKRTHLQFKSTARNLQAMRTLRGQAKTETPQIDTTDIIEQPMDGELKKLLQVCLEQATNIDRHTRRQQAAELVAGLVYQLSRRLGHDLGEALIHFGAGLVYDIGFLNLNPALFKVRHFNEDQFELIKTHPLSGLAKLDFIPDEYLATFHCAVAMHHENMDGSGYPAGLKTTDIPWIARALRVSETYIALITNRAYNRRLNHEAAIRELRRNSRHFDPVLIAALDSLSSS